MLTALGNALDVAVMLVLAAAATAKATEPGLRVRSIAALAIAAEAAVVVLDAAAGPLPGGAAAAAFLIAATAWTLAFGPADEPCACFGPISRQVGRRHVMGRNAVLLTAALVAAAGADRAAFSPWALVAGAALAATLLLEEAGCAWPLAVHR